MSDVPVNNVGTGENISVDVPFVKKKKKLRQVVRRKHGEND